MSNRRISFLMIIIMAICAVGGVSGCSSKDNTNAGIYYRISDINRHNCGWTGFRYGSDGLIGYMQMSDEDTVQYSLCSYNPDTNEDKELYSFADTEVMLDYAAGEDVVKILMLDNSEPSELRTYLVTLDTDGVDRRDVTEDIGDMFSAINARIAVVDGSGNTYITMENGKVCLVPADNGNVTVIEADSSMIGMTTDSDGTIYELYFDGDDRLVVKDFAGEKSDVIINTPSSIEIKQVSDKSYDSVCYAWNSDASYRINLQNGEMTEFLNAGQAGLISLRSIGVIGGKPVSVSSMDGNVAIMKIEESDEPLKERGKLVLGTFGFDFNELQMIEDFNLTNPDYRIEVRNYSSDVKEEDNPVDYLRQDIIDGNIPDILIYPKDAKMYEFVDNGIFADMRELIEADSELSADMFVDGIVDIYTYHDCMYGLPAFFSLSTAIGRKDVWGDTLSVTFDDMTKVMSGAGMKYLDIGAYSPERVLSMLMYGGTRSFVDESGLTFSEDDIAAYIEAAGKYANAPDPEKESLDWYQMMCDKEIALSCDYLIAPYVLDRNEDIESLYDVFDGSNTFVGYPGLNGGCGTYFDESFVYSISSTCKDKDAAWQYIRQYYLDDYQMDEKNTESFFPVKKSCLKKVVEGLNCDKYYKDKVMELIDSARYSIERESGIMDIVIEEGEAYWAGDRSLAEAAQNAYSRIKLYAADRNLY